MKKIYLKVCILLSMLFVYVNSYANVPSWLIGKWTDGNIIVEITSESKMKIYERDILIKEGIFSFDNVYIETHWEKDLKPNDEYYFICNASKDAQWIAHEGGDKLTKLPANTISDDDKSQEKDYSGKLDSHIFVKNSKRCWKNISWVYGEWRVPTNHPSGKAYAVKITPFYYQATADKTDSEKIDFSVLPKKWYKVMEGEHSLLGDVIYIDDLYFDLTAKRIYQSNLDKKIYLEQTVEYTTSKAKTIFWVVFSILAIGILLGLYFLIRKLVRIVIVNVKRFVAWFKVKWDIIRPKAIASLKRAKTGAREQWNKNIKPKTSSAFNRMSEGIKAKTADAKNKADAVSETKDENTIKKSKAINLSGLQKCIIIIVCIIVFPFCLPDSCTGEYAEDSQDYSWICGNWQVTTGISKETICFLSNGIYIRYTEDFFSDIRSQEKGEYEVQPSANKVRLYAEDGDTSYIKIDGNKLTKYGITYRRISN